MVPEVVKIFAGFDAREEYGFHTFVSSVLHHASCPVSITPVDHNLLRGVWAAGDRDGSTSFAYARFCIPWIQRFSGWALFVDAADMICVGDIAELWALRDPYMAVQCVQHSYTTRHSVKYAGTLLECENRDYKRKQWSSVMLINCANYAWRDLSPDYVQQMSGETLHQFAFIKDERIGALPVEWNWLPQEFGHNPTAKLLHYTIGIPAFPAYAKCAMSDEWAAAAVRVTHVTL